MCTKSQCHNAVGQWVSFQTPWGAHRGVVHSVSEQTVLMRVPSQFAPTGLAGMAQVPASEEQRLNLSLAQWGYDSGMRPAGVGGGYPYGGAPGYGRRPGYGWWAGGWWWWLLSFALIWAFAFMW